MGEKGKAFLIVQEKQPAWLPQEHFVIIIVAGRGTESLACHAITVSMGSIEFT